MNATEPIWISLRTQEQIDATQAEKAMNPLERMINDPAGMEKTRRELLAKPIEWWSEMTGDPVENITPAYIEQAIRDATDDYEVWGNEIYTVHMREIGGDPRTGRMVHLSIKRNDRAPVSDWRDKQAIKNQLCGEDASGIELYPSEGRVVDTANQYHLWVFLDGEGRAALESLGFPRGVKKDCALANSKQRPREKCLVNTL